MKKIFVLIICTGIVLSSCYYDNKEELYQFMDTAACDLQNITYSVEVVGVIQQYCIACHSNTRQDGGVNLEGYDNAKLYGQVGSLYGSIIGESGYSPMPPGGSQIPQCDQDKIKIWIDAGMPNN